VRPAQTQGVTVPRDGDPCPAFPSAIRRAYDLLLAGVSLDSIAGTWNAAGLPADPGGMPAQTGRRGAWTANRVRSVLADPRYVDSGSGPCLVDEELWSAAVGVLNAPPRRAPMEPERALLSAIAACGVCGVPVRSAVISPGQTAYRCGGGEDGFHLARSCAPVDARIKLEVLDRLSRPGAPDLLADRHTPDLHALSAHSAGLRTRMGQLDDAAADGTVDRPAAADATARLGAELSTVEEQMTDHAVRDVPGSLTGADPLDGAWDRLAVSRQRGVIIALAERVELHPIPPGRRAGDPDVLRDTVRITWRAT
jgi:site-specific DNA recombinase